MKSKYDRQHRSKLREKKKKLDKKETIFDIDGIEWTIYTSPEGKLYYYNPLTSETKWKIKTKEAIEKTKKNTNASEKVEKSDSKEVKTISKDTKKEKKTTKRKEKKAVIKNEIEEQVEPQKASIPNDLEAKTIIVSNKSDTNKPMIPVSQDENVQVEKKMPMKNPLFAQLHAKLEANMSMKAMGKTIEFTEQPVKLYPMSITIEKDEVDSDAEETKGMTAAERLRYLRKKRLSKQKSMQQDDFLQEFTANMKKKTLDENWDVNTKINYRKDSEALNEKVAFEEDIGILDRKKMDSDKTPISDEKILKPLGDEHGLSGVNKVKQFPGLTIQDSQPKDIDHEVQVDNPSTPVIQKKIIQLEQYIGKDKTHEMVQERDDIKDEIQHMKKSKEAATAEMEITQASADAHNMSENKSVNKIDADYKIKRIARPGSHVERMQRQFERNISSFSLFGEEESSLEQETGNEETDNDKISKVEGSNDEVKAAESLTSAVVSHDEVQDDSLHEKNSDEMDKVDTITKITKTDSNDTDHKAAGSGPAVFEINSEASAAKILDRKNKSYETDIHNTEAKIDKTDINGTDLEATENLPVKVKSKPEPSADKKAKKKKKKSRKHRSSSSSSSSTSLSSSPKSRRRSRHSSHHKHVMPPVYTMMPTPYPIAYPQYIQPPYYPPQPMMFPPSYPPSQALVPMSSTAIASGPIPIASMARCSTCHGRGVGLVQKNGKCDHCNRMEREFIVASAGWQLRRCTDCGARGVGVVKLNTGKCQHCMDLEKKRKEQMQVEAIDWDDSDSEWDE